MSYDGPWISKIYIYFDDSDGPCIAETSILMPKFLISMVGFQNSNLNINELAILISNIKTSV